ncbi:pyridoxal-dependent decarboxylase [Methanolobus mangrovi]|uniref:Pyridoxal-dependent decarboxylase n=1 Tax=Methanolobus mangrovi TaxID=3072977 RepID=A0AA51YJB0_9EURY|nr:pyridoxal-dependent decarboxylase [Methanolobus mangrovi]WMW21964.1 pyridoxal-dependent decarboxylase [Methanolobus mangrovi]
MTDIELVRSYFTKPSGDEDRIVLMLNDLLEKIDNKENGTVIGKKKPLDYEKLMRETKFPYRMSNETDVGNFITGLYEGINLWSHPLMQPNVVPPTTTLSIIAATLGARYNENSISDDYGMSAARSEIMAIAMLADLIGYDTTKAGGIFTFGGTGCNLYGARIGIEKADPNAKNTGIRDRIHFFCSEVSHYSIKSAAIWTGVGLDNVKTIPSYDNVMDVRLLEEEMEKTINDGARIGTIFATMGTTDAFGIDPLKKIVEVRNRIQKKLDYQIHIHADAVIGWPYLTFRGDTCINHLPHLLQEEIKEIVSKISELQYADSVGIDFHKTGWAPYLCSAFVIKDRKDLSLLQKQKKDMPYLFHGEGYQPGTFTLESSRPNYAQKALANMMLLGKQGYETLIIHLITAANHLREMMDDCQDIELLNRHNPAFVTDFRIYPHTKYDSVGESLYLKEMCDENEEKFTDKVNSYNQRIAQYMIEKAQHEGTAMISYTDNYKTTRLSRTIVALKSYPMSPFVEKEHMDEMLRQIYRAKEWVDTNCAFDT